MSKKILVVDDIKFIIEYELQMLETLSRELSDKFEIDTAISVSEATEMISKELYDAIIVDMHLPDGTGVEIATAAREKQKDVRIAVMTISPYDDEIYRPLFDLFLKKPVPPHIYTEHIRKLLTT